MSKDSHVRTNNSILRSVYYGQDFGQMICSHPSAINLPQPTLTTSSRIYRASACLGLQSAILLLQIRVCPLHLSVRRTPVLYALQTNAHIGKLFFPPSGGRITSVFFRALPQLQNSKGNSLIGALDTRGGKLRFSTNCSLSRKRYEIGPYRSICFMFHSGGWACFIPGGTGS